MSVVGRVFGFVINHWLVIGENKNQNYLIEG